MAAEVVEPGLGRLSETGYLGGLPYLHISANDRIFKQIYKAFKKNDIDI